MTPPRTVTTLALLCLGLAAQAAPQALAEVAGAQRQAIDHWLEPRMPGLIGRYQQLHSQPELSLQESKTAALVADQLRQAGYTVHEGIGGHGVAGVLANGPGPTLLIRGDMDALPVTEDTGLPYASKVTVENAAGDHVGVMHACGHDIHTVGMLGTAQLLAALRDDWRGTLIFVGQPAEELGSGSLAMIQDGLFERVGRPDFALALHVEPELAAGQVGYTMGWTGANVDSVDITIFGRGGHGAGPHKAVDPIVTSAYLITQLQTLVSRRIAPREPAVVTVGSIHGGSKHNIIPEQVQLQLTVRSYADEVRQTLIEGIRGMARDTCASFQCPQPPAVSVRDHYTPSIYSDPALVRRAATLFKAQFGAEQVVNWPPSMGGDDFARYARTLKVPGMLFRIGTTDPERLRASRQPGGEPLPTLHSSHYAPEAAPALQTAVRAMSLLALELLDRP